MKIEKRLLHNSIVELVVEEDTNNIAKYRKNALAHLEKKSNIKGFRKGAKIPESILVRQYSEEYVNRMTIDFAIDGVYKAAITKEKILPVAQAEITEIISESPLKFVIHIEVFPIIEIEPKYKDIKLTKQKISVEEDEITNALKEIETKFTKFEHIQDKEIKAAIGDKVTINTEGFENGNILESTTMVNYPLILGSNILVSGFEEKIIGASINDKLEFPVDFPADYHNTDFAGKKTIFKVTINKLEKAVKPEFTPEFIEQLRGKKLDLEGFKKLIKEEITETKQANARIEEEMKLVDELVKITKMEIGVGLLKNQTENVYEEIKENISKDGLKISDYLESLKMNEEQYKEINVKPIALKRLQGELILHKLADLEKLEVTDEETKKEIDTILTRFGSEDVLARLKALYVPGTKYYEELKQRIGYRKLIDSFFEIKES